MTAERHVVTVFRSRLAAEGAEGYPTTAAEMLALARGMPGLVDVKTFAADDGERVTIVTFDSWAHHRAWRDHPDHREAQRLGRERFYDEYTVQVCELVQEHHFTR